MRVVTCLFTLLLLAGMPRAFASDDSQMLVQGMLVLASNSPGQTDERIAPYEPNLKRVLAFQSYKSVGDGNTALTVPGVGKIDLGKGHHLDLEGVSADRNVVRVRVKWTEGKREVMSTTLKLIRGTPAVLGGPQVGSSGDVYAIILLVL